VDFRCSERVNEPLLSIIYVSVSSYSSIVGYMKKRWAVAGKLLRLGKATPKCSKRLDHMSKRSFPDLLGGFASSSLHIQLVFNFMSMDLANYLMFAEVVSRIVSFRLVHQYDEHRESQWLFCTAFLLVRCFISA
jgi:hypothetical protein